MITPILDSLLDLAKVLKTVSDYVLQLEQENERLKTELDSRVNQNEPDARDAFIELIAQDVEFYESKYQQTTERMRKIVDAYRIVRPKGEEGY
jgi:hypothetical protein